MSQPLPGLTVDSVTGIDVSLAVAGPGARAFAFLADWHIRVILAVGWFAAAALVYNQRLSLTPPPPNEVRWFGAVVVPALAIYFLYHYVLELAMRGSTPGKRLAGVRIVARDGSTPGAAALLARNVFRLVDSLPLFYGVGLTATIMTREHVRIGDMAAGTLLVYENADARSPTPLAAAGRAGLLDAVGAEIVAELLERWPSLTPASRAQLARQVLARYAGDAGTGAPADEAALLARLERLAGRPADPAA
jgi:uncharacterized RDD family membrane protein YckC